MIDISSFSGGSLIDIGRMLHPGMYDEDVPFQDYDGSIYLKFNIGNLIFHPIPTLQGDFIEIYTDETFKQGEMQEVSFIDYFSDTKGGKLQDFKLTRQEEGVTEVRLTFDKFGLRLFLAGGDELAIEVIH